MKILDTRIRPPFGSFKGGFYNQSKNRVEATKKLAKGRFGMPTPPSLDSGSMEMLLEEMDAAGVEQAISPVRVLNGDNDNVDAAKLCQAYPDKFFGVPTVDLFFGKQENLRIIDDYIVNGPCRALMVEPGFSEQPMYADDERFYYIYEKCENEQIPLMMAFGGFIGPDYSYCQPLHIDHIARDFPKLKLFLTHGGWPYVTQGCHVASNHRNVWVAPDLYLMRSPGWRDYVEAANCMLLDKICYGSAYPIVDIQAAVAYYMQAGFSEEALPKVMHDNAAVFLGLMD